MINPKKIIRYLWIVVSLFTLIAVAVAVAVDVAMGVSVFMFFLTVPASVLGVLFMNLLQGYGLLPTREVFLAVFAWFVYFCVGYLQWVWFVGGILDWLSRKYRSRRAVG